ncbi:MAG: hypothetical protein ACTH5B_19835 [Marinomonas sp.]|uniref:hypothetical protein n=1 Tax=Marinomonas sp. TaxID=1904862 RepID=UPI003F9D9F67
MTNELILYTTDDGQPQFMPPTLNGNKWLTQREIEQLYQTSRQNISKHIKSILAEKKLTQAAVFNAKLTTAFKGVRIFHSEHYIDDSVNIDHNEFNITVTLSALFSLIKGVTRNLGGFFVSKNPQSKKQKAKICL